MINKLKTIFMKKSYQLSVGFLLCIFALSNNALAQTLVLDAGPDQSICAMGNINPYQWAVTISVSVTGGTQPYNYQWSPANALSSTYSNVTTAAPNVTTTYTVVVTDNTGSLASDCITIFVNPLPADYTVTGGGSFCSGGTGASVGLSGSQTGVTYQLQLDSVYIGSPLAGNGNPLNFGIQSAEGIYSVIGVIDSSACTNYMTGSATLNSYNPVAAFTMYPDSITLHHYYVINNATGIAPISYIWSWGDGTTDSVAYPSHTYSSAGNYTICLTITDSSGCSNSFCDSSYIQKSTNEIISVDVIPQGTAGIGSIELSDQEMIYPNPATNNLTIETPQKSLVKIFNIQGRLLITVKANDKKTDIDVSELPNGIYILELKTENGSDVIKFVKE
jgi:PKD repeat protein